MKPAAGYRPLAYSSPEAVQSTGTVADSADGKKLVSKFQHGEIHLDKAKIEPKAAARMVVLASHLLDRLDEIRARAAAG